VDSKTLLKKLVFPVVSMGIGSLVTLIVLEIICRILPVTHYTNPMPVNEADPIPRMEPNRKFTFSKDWNLNYANKVQVNNDGFVNDQTYTTADTRPLVAVVGDSYIEAQIVPYAKTVHGRLATKHSMDVKVYSFGMSNAPLSTYLRWAQYSREKYNSQFLIINVVGNDFDESLGKYRKFSGGYDYAPEADGTLRLRRVDYMNSGYRFLWKSALIRYTLLNLRGIITVKTILNGENKQFVGNTDAQASPERVSDSKQVIKAFFRDLPGYSGLPPERTLFLIDGMRPHLYDKTELANANGSYFSLMREEFITQARERGYEIIDLQPAFIAEYERSGTRFEYPTDGHWNEFGHGVAAAVIEQSTNFHQMIVSIRGVIVE